MDGGTNSVIRIGIEKRWNQLEVVRRTPGSLSWFDEDDLYIGCKRFKSVAIYGVWVRNIVTLLLDT